MVSARRLVLLASLALSAQAVAKDPGDYHIGETVEADIITPVALHVVDAEATAALRDKERGRVPAIFKLDASAADLAEQELRDSFTRARSSFLKRLQRTFKQSKLDAETIAQTNFEAFVASFQKSNRNFPVTTNLAALWASGDAGRVFQASVIARLRAQQERPLRSGALPPAAKRGSRVLLVTVTNPAADFPLALAQKQGKTMARTNFVGLFRARSELTVSFPSEERAVGKFVATLLREDCFFATNLTHQARTRQTAGLLVADNFAAGKRVARRGQIVDAKLKAVLDELHEQTKASQLAARVDAEQARAERIKVRAEQFQNEADASQARAAAAEVETAAAQAIAMAAREKADQIRRRNQWLVAGLVVAVAGVGLLSWRLARRKRPSTLLPARIAGSGVPATVVACPSCDETIVISTATATGMTWQQRAHAAEQRAERAQAALRAGAFAQFGHWLKQHFAQRLLTERSQMLDTQESAAAEMAEFERRLDELHAPLQERLSAYEKRVVELEKSLAEKTRENRQLIEAKIQLIRKQMETERARTEMELN